MKRIGLATGLALLIGGVGAHAAPPARVAFYRGSDIWDACGRTTESRPAPVCVAYITGVMDGVTTAAGAQPFCTPQTVSAGEVTDAVRSYLKAHPERREDFAAVLVLQALVEAYPCGPARP